MKSEPNNLSRIKKLGGVLKIFAIAGIISLPWIKPLLWLFYNQLPGSMHTKFSALAPAVLPVSIKLIGVLIALPSSIIVFLLIANSIKLFSLYARGYVLEKENAAYIKNTGMYLLLNTLYTIVLENPLTTVALTWNALPGHRSLSFGLSSSDCIAVFAAGFLFITAYVTLEAHKTYKDAELTI
jgi:hypothetical protein